MEYHTHISKQEDLEATKQQLALLLQEDAKDDKSRNLPLSSSEVTHYKYVCSKCYDWSPLPKTLYAISISPTLTFFAGIFRTSNELV
jgi:hypothetical protein